MAKKEGKLLGGHGIVAAPCQEITNYVTEISNFSQFIVELVSKILAHWF